MTQSQMLQPGDLPAEDMIRLHAELEGDPSSAAHREAWDRWQAWLEQLSASGDPAQTGRSARIGQYISTTFPEPTRPATGSLLTGGAGVIGAGAAAYEIGHHVVGHGAAQAAAHTAGMAGAAPGGAAGAAGAAAQGAGAAGAGSGLAGATGGAAAHGAGIAGAGAAMGAGAAVPGAGAAAGMGGSVATGAGAAASALPGAAGSAGSALPGAAAGAGSGAGRLASAGGRRFLTHLTAHSIWTTIVTSVIVIVVVVVVVLGAIGGIGTGKKATNASNNSSSNASGNSGSKGGGQGGNNGGQGGNGKSPAGPNPTTTTLPVPPPPGGTLPIEQTVYYQGMTWDLYYARVIRQPQQQSSEVDVYLRSITEETTGSLVKPTDITGATGSDSDGINLVWGGQTDGADLTGPSGSQAVLQFTELPLDFDVNTAQIVFGDPTVEQVAQVPLGTTGKLVTLEPQPVDVSGQTAETGDITVDMTDANLAAEVAEGGTQAPNKKLVLYVEFNVNVVDKNQVLANGGDVGLTAYVQDPLGHKITDGVDNVAGEWTNNMPAVSYQAGETKGQFLRFQIPEEPGSYNLVLQENSAYADGAPYQGPVVDIPIEVPPLTTTTNS